MAVGERELRITLRAIISDFISPMKTASAEVKAFGTVVDESFDKIESRAENMKHVWKDMLEAFIGVEIVDQLFKIAEGASHAHDALEIAANTAKNFGHAFDASAMESWLQKLAKSAEGGGYAITDLRDATQQLATTGANAAQIQRLLTDAVGLAATKHIALSEATHLVVEAATGHVEILGRYGIAVKNAAGETLSFAQVMSNLESEIAGNAQKRFESLEGAVGRLATAGNNLVTGPFGATLASIFTTAVNVLAQFLGLVAQLPAPMQAFGAETVVTLAGLSALGLMLPAVKLAFGFLADGILLVRDSLVLGFKAIVMFYGGLRDLVTWLQLARDAFAGVAVAEWLAEAPIIAIIGVVTALVAILVEAVRGFKDLGTIWGWISGLFKQPELPHLTNPKTPLTGLGGPDKDAQKTIDDWLTARKAAITGAVALATQAVDEAQARLEAAAARVSELRDKRDPTAPLTAGNVAEEERLVTEQLEREQDVRAAIAQQRNAELAASRQLNALAGQLPALDKDAAQHAAELRAEAEKHLIAAIKLGGEYDKLGGTIAKMAAALAQIPLQLAQQAANLAKVAAQSMHDSFTLGWEETIAHLKSKFEQSQVRPANGPEDAARRRVAGATFDLTNATNATSQAQSDLDFAKRMQAQVLDDIAKGLIPFADQAKAAADAQHAVERASIGVSAAFDNLALASKKLNEAKAEEHSLTAKTILDKTAAKIPGVSVGATGSLSFSWASVLADAIAQSHAFANVMQLVNELMSTFTQIIDAFEPVIDALLKVTAILANGFIALWNTIAKIIGILGIHLQQLQYINENFGPAAANMVTFVHDIPTLNELASGNIGPLTTSASNNPWSIIHEDLVTNNANQQGWFGTLINAALALLAIDWLTHGHFLAGLQQWIPQIWNNIGTFFRDLPQSLVNVWNGFQNWLSNTFGPKLAGFVDVAGGVALLDSHTQGVMGWLQKILGVLLIVQGIMQALGAGSIFGGSGNGIGGALGLASGAGGGSGGLGGIGMLKGISGAGGLGAGLAGAGIGFGVGSLLGNVLGGNSTNGGIGGAIGGGLAGGLGLGSALGMTGAFAGPAGILIGSLLGGAIGQLFGPHYSATTNPDMYANSGYAQGFANYQGQMGTQATGEVAIDPAVAQALGGLTEGQFLSKWIAANPALAQQTLTPGELADLTGSTGITNLHQGIVTFTNGAQDSWETALSNISDALTKINAVMAQSNGSGSSSSSQSESDLIAAALQAAGFAATGSGSTMAVTPTINVYGDVVGYNDVQQLGEDLGQATIATINSRRYSLNLVSSAQ